MSQMPLKTGENYRETLEEMKTVDYVGRQSINLYPPKRVAPRRQNPEGRKGCEKR